MHRLSALAGGALYFSDRVGTYLRRAWLKHKMQCDDSVYIGPGCVFTTGTVSIGRDVYIGRDCVIQSTHGRIVIGDHVMFGPGVHIHGGNHVTDHVGVFMKEVDAKRVGEDGMVVIEDDFWIGACAIILKGVTVGEGSVIGAGAVVTRDIPPYSVYTGAPAERLRPRFTEAEVEAHKKALMSRERGNG